MYSFYAKEEHINILKDIIEGKNGISLRIIDWFVTNYTKTYETKYLLPNNKQILVHSNYKAQLKAYSKKMFDPFCRRNRLCFEYAPGKYIDTTVGQLNFFKWAIQNKLIDYISQNIKCIEQGMLTKNVKAKMPLKNNHMSQHHITVTLNFH